MRCLVRLFVLFSCTLSVLCTCSYTDTDGNYYDLSPLTYDPSSASPSNYQITDTAGNTYYINFCAEVSESIGNGTCNENYPSGSCQHSGISYYSCGALSTYTWIPYQSKYYFKLH